METASITEFLRDPKSVIRRLQKADDVIIERRDAAPLRLTLSSRVDENRDATGLLARLLVRALPEVAHLVWVPLVEAQPWLRFLPEHERPTFLREFLETIEACASIGNNAQLSRLLREWKATAEVYSDPELSATLRNPSRGGGGRVPRPKPPRR